MSQECTYSCHRSDDAVDTKLSKLADLHDQLFELASMLDALLTLQVSALREPTSITDPSTLEEELMEHFRTLSGGLDAIATAMDGYEQVHNRASAQAVGKKIAANH